MKLSSLLPWSRKANGEVTSIDQLIERWAAIWETAAGIAVTPENCEESPTVKAIVTAITRRFQVMPAHVYRWSEAKGREKKEYLPKHPVERLLNEPNDWQSRAEYWGDAASRIVRYGNFYAFKGQGQTGPIRRLTPLHPSSVEPLQDDNWNVTYRVTMPGGRHREVPPREVHHVRLAARDSLKGDSPVMDVRESIALEIAAEKFGSTFFGNGAMPGVVFGFRDGFEGFKSDAERKAFIDEFHRRWSGKQRFRAILPPNGIEIKPPIPVENDKAQFIELRGLQRTIIAGAFGVPPHLVGDLSKGTFNNVEHQGIEFNTNVILPIARMFEAAMERDLLTGEDRRGGVIIRFNPDAYLRGAFKERQEGLAIQRINGVISPNEWREHEGMNPRPDPGGDDYYATGPSGQAPASATPTAPADGGTGDNPDEP